MEKILIGTILRPQGLNGEIKCKLENPNYEILKNVTEVYLQNKDVPSRVVSKRFSGGYLYIKLGLIDCREKVELLRGFNIYAERKFLEIPDNEYVVSDIIGSDVVDESGASIGTLLDVQNFGATDIFVIEQYKREYLVPFVKDIVVNVLPVEKKIVVNRKNYDEAKVCE